MKSKPTRSTRLPANAWCLGLRAFGRKYPRLAASNDAVDAVGEFLKNASRISSVVFSSAPFSNSYALRWLVRRSLPLNSLVKRDSGSIRSFSLATASSIARRLAFSFSTLLSATEGFCSALPVLVASVLREELRSDALIFVVLLGTEGCSADCSVTTVSRLLSGFVSFLLRSVRCAFSAEPITLDNDILAPFGKAMSALFPPQPFLPLCWLAR